MPFAAAAAVGAIGSAIIGGNASEQAANTEANAANSASQVQQNMFNTVQKNLSPFISGGQNALTALLAQTGIGANGSFNPNASLVAPFSAQQYQQSPGYQFQLQQGLNATQNAAAAHGGVYSGNTLKALTQYGQGLANTDYQQALQNYMTQQSNTFNKLSGLAGSGQNAAANLGGFSGQTAAAIGNNITGAGSALAAGQIGVGNAASGGLNSLAYLLAGQGSAGAGGFSAGGMPSFFSGGGGSTDYFSGNPVFS